MISFTYAQWEGWLAAFFWPFFRILGFIASSPFFGARGVPATTKVGLALLLTMLVAPLLPPMPQVSPASAYGLFILAQQLLIGIAMGLALRVIFTAVEMAGHIVGLQMGLGFATFFDPQNSAQIPVMGQFLGVIAMLLFLAINGHLMVISALVESFRSLPVGMGPLASEGWLTLARWGGEIFHGGVLIAMPALAVLMMTNMALAILTRAAPQLNIFAVGFPLTLAVGFIVLALSISYLMPIFSQMLESSVQTMMTVVQDAARQAEF